MSILTSAWLDSIQELSGVTEDMPDTGGDSNSDRHLFKVLGGLGSDVKHILASQERSRQDTNTLRMEVQQEMNEVRARIDKEMSDLSVRVSRLETFNTKILAVVGFVLPAVIFGGQLVAPWLLAKF